MVENHKNKSIICVFSQSDKQLFYNLNRPIQHAAELKLWNEKCDYIDLTKTKNLKPIKSQPNCATHKHKGNAHKTFWINCTFKEMPEMELSNWYSHTMWNLPHTDKENYINNPGYCLITKNRTNKNDGGVGILINNKLKHILQNDKDESNIDFLESIFIEIDTK